MDLLKLLLGEIYPLILQTIILNEKIKECDGEGRFINKQNKFPKVSIISPVYNRADLYWGF